MATEGECEVTLQHELKMGSQAVGKAEVTPNYVPWELYPQLTLTHTDAGNSGGKELTAVENVIKFFTQVKVPTLRYKNTLLQVKVQNSRFT